MQKPPFSIALCLVILLTGCGSTAPAGPTTHVQIGLVTADLPGTDWQMTNKATKGRFVVETWKNKDESLIYRVSSDPDEVKQDITIDGDAVDDYLTLMDYPGSSHAEGGNLNGVRAVHLEAVRPGPGEYHLIEYVIVAGFRQYYIGAGAKNSIWENGGKDSVDAIFMSVKTEGSGN